MRELERLHRDLGRPRERVRMLEALLALATRASACRSRAKPRRCGPDRSASLSEPPRTCRRPSPRRRVAAACTSSCCARWANRCAPPARPRRGPAARKRSCARSTPRRPSSRTAAVELARALARAYEHELHRPDEALRHLRSLSDGPAAQALPPEVFREIEDALLRLLRVCAGPVELESQLAARLERGPATAEGWLELARLRDEKLRASAAAAQAYRRALELAPDSIDALRGLRGVAERLGAWDEVAETLELELEQAASAPAGERAALLRRLGDVSWQRLQSTTQASRCYAAALEADPHDFEALRALAAPARGDGGLARRARPLRERGRDAGRARPRARDGRPVCAPARSRGIAPSDPARALRAYLAGRDAGSPGAGAAGRARGAAPALRRRLLLRRRVRELVRRPRGRRGGRRSSAPGRNPGSARPTGGSARSGGALARHRRRAAGGLEAGRAGA